MTWILCGTVHFVTYLTAAGVSQLEHCSFSVNQCHCHIDERRLIFTERNFLCSLPVVYYEYISLSSQYCINDPL